MSNPLEGVVRNVISKMAGGDRPTREGITKAWADAVGKNAARHTRPVSLKRSTLTVNVNGSGWLYELTLKKKEILAKLGKTGAGERIQGIRFRIGEIK